VEEHTEDVQRFGGMEALDEPYTQIGFFSMIKKRAPWLSALFLSEMLTTSAMGHFQDELAKAVVLALFIPLIISSGGNSGSQATSLIIRALALQELRLRDWWKVALRELPSGLVLGLILGLMGIIRILLWHHLGIVHYPHPNLLALTIGIALIGVVAFGSLAGAMLPFVLQRLGFDPASALGPLRRHSRRRHRAVDLFLRRAFDSSRDTALAVADVAVRKQTARACCSEILLGGLG